MKTELPQSAFVFNPTTKTIDFSSFSGFDPSRLFAVMNITSEQKLIYAVASYAQGLGGSFFGSVLMLSYDTSSMSASDTLMVIYDDQSIILNTEITNFPSVQDVSVTASVLPTGASTSVLQSDGNSSLSSIDGKLETTANGLKVDGSAVTQPVSGTVSVDNFPATQDVSVLNSALPLGAATESTVASIDSKTIKSDTDHVTISSPLPAGSNIIGSVDINSGTLTATFDSEGATGSPVPPQAIYIAGNDAGNLRPVDVNHNGITGINSLQVDASSTTTLPLPSNASTSLVESYVSTPAPSKAVQVGGVRGSDNKLYPLSVSESNNGILVDASTTTSFPLPTGAATESTLSSLDSKVTTVDTSDVTITGALPAGSNTIGKVDINGTLPISGSISVDNFPAVQAVSATSLPLPTGAATETTVSSIDGKLSTTPNGLKVDAVGTVDIGSSALPTGAATETTLSSIDGKLTTTPSGLKVDAVGTVDIGSSALPMGAATETTLASLDGKVTTTPSGIKVDAVGTIDIGSSALPTGAATETTLSSLDGKVTTTPNGIKVDTVGTVDIGSSALPIGASTEATLSNLDSKVTTTVNGIKVDSIVSSGQIDSYLHDGSGTAITSTTVSSKQAIDVNVASGTFTVTATNPSVGVNGATAPTSSTEIGLVSYDGKLNGVTGTIIGDKNAIDVSIANDPSYDVLATQIIGTRNNQIEINFENAPDTTIITNTTSGGATITQANGHTLYATGTATSAEAKGVSVGTIIYRPAHEIYAYFTASFTTPTSANSYQRIGAYDANNGFFIGFNGTTFGLTKRTSASDTFTGRTSFNGDLLNGAAGSQFTRNGTPEAINLNYSNLFRIRFAWLGSAPILFDVLSPDGVWVTFHTIKQPNSSLNPSIANPNLPMTVDVQKSGANSTNLIVATACWAGGTTSDLAPITDILTDNSLATLTRSVITGVTTGGGGGYRNVKVNPSGALTVDASVSSLPSIPAGSNTIGAISNTSFGISGTLPAFASTPTVNLGTIAGVATETTLSGLNTKVTTTVNGIKVDGSAVTQPVSGSVTATISGTPNVAVTSSALPSGASTSALQTTANSSLSSIDGKLTSVTVGTLPSIPAGANNIGSITNVTGTVSLPTGASTSALQTTANSSLSSIVTNTGAISGQLPPTIGPQGSLNSLSVTMASDSSALQVKTGLNKTASGTTSTVSTVTTLTAPTNAVGFILMNLDTSSANIRWAIGRTASATIGQQLQPARDTGFIPCGVNISICAESGTQNYDVTWVSQ
jgi:hypothetical protein